MKAAVAALLLFALLTTGVFVNSYILTQAAEELTSEAETILPLAAEGADCTEPMSALLEKWEGYRFAFSLTINHTEFDLLEETLARAAAAAEIKSDGELYLAVATVADMFAHIGALAGISADNIL